MMQANTEFEIAPNGSAGPLRFGMTAERCGPS